jgi:hypothetical protein
MISEGILHVNRSPRRGEADQGNVRDMRILSR